MDSGWVARSLVGGLELGCSVLKQDLGWAMCVCVFKCV